LSSRDPVGSALAGRSGLEIDPNNPQLSLHLAYALDFAGMLPEAARWYGRTLELSPGRMWPLFGLTFNAIGAGDLEAARARAAEARRAGADASIALYGSALVSLFTGDLEAAETALRPLVASPPDLGFRAFPSPDVLLAWAGARVGRARVRPRLEALRHARMEEAASGPRSADLTVIASALGENEEQLRWFLDMARLEKIRTDEVTVSYHLRAAPWLDRIRESEEFRAWLRDREQLKDSLCGQLDALGGWTPEEVLGRGSSSASRPEP
jgi:hypothetical protein